MNDHRVIGWREWVALPQLGLPALKAKIDTGARSSSLHVETLRVDERADATWLLFEIDTGAGGRVSCQAPAVDRRAVTDSGGNTTLRWFIFSKVRLAGLCWQAEINLSNRRKMRFPMLLGRTALRGRFLVDPELSYQCGRSHRRASLESR